ncbi:MAG TPA: phosphate ABC transporter permease PstC, partial [Burkholderiales bacterium]
MSAVANTLEGLAGRAPAAAPASRAIPDARLRRHPRLDLLFRLATRAFAFLVLALLVAILASLVVGSLPAIGKFGLGFLTDATWNPVTEQFGGLAPIVGTL